jgi:hypothetical protein
LRSRNALRIVVLHRGSFNDPINSSILHYDEGKIPKSYEALSYEWGPELASDPSIRMNGHPVCVRTNLHLALQHIRWKDGDRHIWIDQLSINQADDKERGHQVRIMGQIYASAAHVIIWLGPAAERSDEAMVELANWGSHSQRDQCIVDGGWSTPDASPILALLNRTYWRRVWIQQEIHLARDYTVHCGTFHVEKTSITEARDFLVENQGKLIGKGYKAGVETLLRTTRKWYTTLAWANSRDYRYVLESWLRMGMNASLQSTEPRDFIYAMLGISTDC